MKKAQKQLSLKNWKKLLYFLIFQKTYKSEEKFPSANRVSRCKNDIQKLKPIP